jgi:hypothetical protein
MKRKTLHKIFGIFMFIGFFIVLGAAGASDCGTMTFTKSITVALIGLLVMGIGATGLEFSGYNK